jgi:hypothetical protein
MHNHWLSGPLSTRGNIHPNNLHTLQVRVLTIKFPPKIFNFEPLKTFLILSQFYNYTPIMFVYFLYKDTGPLTDNEPNNW